MASSFAGYATQTDLGEAAASHGLPITPTRGHLQTEPSLCWVSTFVKYACNYTGARDVYVYTASHDHLSAYHAADGVVLLRAPIDRLRTCNAYEWYVMSDPEGPHWTSEISQSGCVFTFPGHCCRSGITYNAPLRHYLWWQQHSFTNGSLLFGDPAVDTRYRGGFGIYDAPEPWGRPDGCNLYLVFSGNDAFSIRGATLHLAHSSD